MILNTRTIPLRKQVLSDFHYKSYLQKQKRPELLAHPCAYYAAHISNRYDLRALNPAITALDARQDISWPPRGDSVSVIITRGH